MQNEMESPFVITLKVILVKRKGDEECGILQKSIKDYLYIFFSGMNAFYKGDPLNKNRLEFYYEKGSFSRWNRVYG